MLGVLVKCRDMSQPSVTPLDMQTALLLIRDDQIGGAVSSKFGRILINEHGRLRYFPGNVRIMSFKRLRLAFLNNEINL